MDEVELSRDVRDLRVGAKGVGAVVAAFLTWRLAGAYENLEVIRPLFSEMGRLSLPLAYRVVEPLWHARPVILALSLFSFFVLLYVSVKRRSTVFVYFFAVHVILHMLLIEALTYGPHHAIRGVIINMQNQ